MTALGVGIDLVDVAGFGDQLAAPGTTLAEVFTAGELADAGRGPDPEMRVRRLAGRFAAKEAFVKAWSGARVDEAPALDRVDLAEIEVRLDRAGRPLIALRGRVLEAVLGSLGDLEVLVSLTHEQATAGAVVVLQSARPSQEAPG